METEELDPTQYRENRLAFLDSLKKSGLNPFLLEFKLSMNLERFRGEFGSAENGQRFETRVCVAGRVMSKRSGGPKLLFYSLESAEGKLQAVADARLAEGDFQAIHSGIKRGDVVGVTGFPGRTKRGEISIFASNFFLLAPCLEMLPKGGKTRDEQESWRPGLARNPNAYALRNQETRYRCRYLDMIVNPEIRHVFGARDGVVDCIRKFLHSRGFSEVETSYLNGKAGGATAKPFITHHKQSKLHLRISPELQLKPLLVSGYEGVCEFGKQFRNEGMDLTHNPEFTTCEFYAAYADYEDLMVMTEKLISELVMEITGGCKVSYHSNGYDNPPVVIDFTPPFRRIEMVKGLEEAMGVELPKDLASDEANELLRATCDARGVFCAPPLTTARLLDKLVGHYLEETCVNPTFIIDHPLIMSPLAKRHRSKVGLTERFELFVNKHELVNAYTELNIPEDQRERFAEQLKDKLVGDSEAMETDEEFITALEYGLPPCAGWGIGVDRLVMLLTDSLSIKEVLLFPTMKPDIISKGSEEQGTTAT